MPIYGHAAAEGEAPPILGVAQCLNKRDGKSFTLTDPNPDPHPNQVPPRDAEISSAMRELLKPKVSDPQPQP